MAKPKPIEPKTNRAVHFKITDAQWEDLQSKLEKIKDETGVAFGVLCYRAVSAFADKEIKRLKLDSPSQVYDDVPPLTINPVGAENVW